MSTPDAVPTQIEAPTAVRSLDLNEGFTELTLPCSPSGLPYRWLLALASRGAVPLGWVQVPVPPSGEVSAEALRRACAERFPDASAAAAGAEDSRVAPPAPTPVSVVVPTCADAEAAVRCVDAILAHGDGPLEVLVVENRPGPESDVSSALASAFGPGAVTYVEQPAPGLSNARNTGLTRASGEIVAFVDDDVIVDRRWLAGLRSGLAAHPEATCLTGPILPLEFETEAQVMFERFATPNKGFSRRVFSLRAPPDDIPLFPYAAGHFGSGQNLVFRRRALVELGGFDPALGTGTPALGGEELDVFIRLILAGQALVYEPRALVWHRHPDTADQLVRRSFTYGAGLGAALSKHMWSGSQRAELARRIPGGIRYLLARDSRKNASKGPDFPRSLELRELVGITYGPVAYARGRRWYRRLARRTCLPVVAP